MPSVNSNEANEDCKKSILMQDRLLADRASAKLSISPNPSAELEKRLRRRFEELGVCGISGAEFMTEEELVAEASKLLQWRDDCLAAGELLFPPNVCIRCFSPHLGDETA